MGLRFSLQHANLVGHLVNGKVRIFLDENQEPNQQFRASLEFVARFIDSGLSPEKGAGSNVFFTTRQYRRHVENDFRWLQEKWPVIQQYWIDAVEGAPDWAENTFMGHELEHFFEVLSKLLSRCKVKSLLLPGFEDNQLNWELRTQETLKDLVEIHPGDSALILQIEEPLTEKAKTVLSVFSRFETAYDRIDEWPGVLFWDTRQSVFIPIEKSADVASLFSELKRSRNLAEFASARAFEAPPKKYVYFFHLSDLHFGEKQTADRERRLSRILERRVRSLKDCKAAVPIITGDIMNTPAPENVTTFETFCEKLKANGFRDPIWILGNHDLRWKGVMSIGSRRREASRRLVDRIVERLPEYGVTFVKFNSSAAGDAAAGKIGQEQFARVSRELDDRNETIKNDTLIALLHHHPVPIEDPPWYRKDWYERWFGRRFRATSQELVDSNAFLEFMAARDMRIALHGHKHIPAIRKNSRYGLTVIAAGSATGQVSTVDPSKTFLSYNLLKYDDEEGRLISCTISAEEVLGAGPKDIFIEVFA